MKFLGSTGTNIKSGDAYAKRLDSHHEAVFLFLELNFMDLCFQFKKLTENRVANCGLDDGCICSC